MSSSNTNNNTNKKSTWPELVGQLATQAMHTIQQERPDVAVELVPHDSMVTMDYVERRVRIFVKDNKVDRSPLIG